MFLSTRYLQQLWTPNGEYVFNDTGIFFPPTVHLIPSMDRFVFKALEHEFSLGLCLNFVFP